MIEHSKIKVLLIEDNEAECNAISDYVDTIDKVELVGVTGDSDKGIILTKELRPNVVILDLELTDGFGTGIRYLQTLQKLGVKDRPYILITTQVRSGSTWNTVRDYGADFILYKHQTGYSAKFVIDTIMQLYISFPTNPCYIPENAIFPDSEEEIKKRIHLRIAEEFLHIGLSSNLVGRNYLMDTIYILVTTKENNNKSFRQLIFPVLSKKYDKTPSSIHRGMITAIEKTWRTVDEERLLKHYREHINPDAGNPTVSEFVYYYAEKIKNDFV